MQSIIDDIYYEKIGLGGEQIKYSEKYNKTKKEYDSLFEKLENTLNKEQKQTLEELFEKSCDLEAELTRLHFKEGFKSGMLIALEVLVK